jgi:hypothetical protein
MTKLLAVSALCIIEPTPGFKMICFLTEFARRKIFSLLFSSSDGVVVVLLPVIGLPAFPFLFFFLLDCFCKNS